MTHAALSPADLQQLKDKGISPETFAQQIRDFESGYPFVKLDRPATIGDGIEQLSAERLQALIERYQSESKNLSVCKMVPASGAASRMFKDLHRFEAGDAVADHPAVQQFLDQLEQFAFYQQFVEGLASKGLDRSQVAELLDLLLNQTDFGYSNLPKGLIPFHAYSEEARTAFEEHLVEAGHYLPESGSVHFTVSENHLERVKAFLAEKLPAFEAHFSRKIPLSYSVQKPQTDTVAVDPENNPFRLEDGSMLFRPGGHGALLENLNDLDADLVFIKNIDNVTHDRLKADTYSYKQALAGRLLELQAQVFAQLHALDANATEALTAAQQFAKEALGVHNADQADVETLKSLLNRPIRICGMVKNEGEPGGGPFWVHDNRGQVSLQIVEKAQIDSNDSSQQEILSQASHFNPVDLLCSTRDFKGEAFDLLKFRDPKTGFITEKSQSGRTLKAQELPGLWNGAMANWITVFVEVPLSTFSPVKTLNDLLKPPHQP